MKLFITNNRNTYERVTSESLTHYICGNMLFPKSDVIEDYYPLDSAPIGKYHLLIVPFFNY